MAFEIEIVLPDGSERTVVVDGPTEVGREVASTEGVAAILVDDPSVSRRHLSLRPDGDVLVVSDLGSAYGTTVDGRRIGEAEGVPGGATIRIGDTTLTVRRAPSDAAAAAPPPALPGPPGPPGPPPAAAPPAPLAPIPPPGRAAPRERIIEGRGIVVRAREGTAGAEVVGSVHDLAVRARKALADLGSEPWGADVTIHVVDPFADPDDPERVVTSGSVVDAATNEIWLVVTAESPPEDPHRPLALLFGAALPAATQVDHLIEGYGLHLAGSPDPDPEVVASIHGALESLDPDERGPLAASFVTYLLAREGDEAFRKLIASPPTRLAETWRAEYGRSATALEAQWRDDASTAPSDVGSGEFLKLSWRYLRPYRRRQAEVFALMLLSLAFTVTYPFVTRALFDDAIPGGQMGAVLQLLGVLAGSFAITLAAGLRQTVQTSRISGSVVRDLRQEMFERLQRVPDAWSNRHPQGDVLSRMMNDVGQVQSGLSTAINDGVFQAVSLVVATIIMLQVNLPLGIIVLLGAPVVAFVYRRMSGGARTRSLAVQEEVSGLVTVAAENLQAAPVVRMFRLADHEERRFDRTSERLYRAQQRLTLFGGLFGITVETIVTILRLAILGIGTWLIFQGNFTLGGLVAFLGVMGEVLSPITGLTSLGQSIQSSVGALIRVDEVLGAEVEPEGADLPALAPIAREIRFDGVSMSYTPESRALDEVDVTIAVGSHVAFVGPSGSGKSSLLKVLMRLYEPDAGRLLVDGVDVATRSLDSYRAQLGVVFQDSFLFDATIRENIALGSPDATDAQVEAAADAAEVTAFASALPRGLDSLVGEGGRNLSGGQRQRVAIARALVGNPAVLVLDEATSALDPGTERQISGTITRVSEGKTVLAVTHRLTSVVDHDVVFVVDAGKVVERGTHDELLALRGLYARLWAEQTGAELPPEPPFDLGPVLEKLPLFADLTTEEIRDVGSRFTPMVVEAGEVLAEGGDRLIVIERGRAEVLMADDDTEAPRREVASGDVFGINAILGEPTGTVLRMTEPSTLLVLSGETLAELRAAHTEIAEAQAGRATFAAAPSGRLLRPTVGPARATIGGTATGGMLAAEVAAAVAAARVQAGANP